MRNLVKTVCIFHAIPVRMDYTMIKILHSLSQTPSLNTTNKQQQVTQ